MQSVEDRGAISPSASKVITLRLKVRSEAYPWLNKAAIEANQVWNWANAESARSARSCTRTHRWLSGFDLCTLSAGGTRHFEHIGADTIQRVCTEYAQKRFAAKRIQLRWRKSLGSGRSLGWVPLKAASIRRHGKYLRFCGKTIRIFESQKFQDVGAAAALPKMRSGTGICVCRSTAKTKRPPQNSPKSASTWGSK